MRRTTKILFFLFLILLLLGGFFGFDSPVFAESGCNDHMVISEIYGGGGNADAQYSNDFIEIYNPTDENVSLTGWSIQYASYMGTFSNSKKTLLDKVIYAKKYYLIGEEKGNNESAALPTPDTQGIISLSSTRGKVVLVKNSATISDENDATVVDFVAYDDASNTKSVYRKTNSCLDSNNFSVDFGTQAPNPQNSSYLEPEPIVYSDQIILNEVFPNPTGSSEKKNEFVEIFNSGDTSVDLVDWYLSGKSGTFKLSGTIEARKYKAFFDTITLYNEKGTIKLFNPADEQVDEITYPNPTVELENFSYSFDGTDWLWTSIPTAGEENKFDPAEDTSDDNDNPPAENTAPDYKIYLNEILPNPKGDEKLGEFIEIYNAENSEVNLAGWTLKDASKTKYVFPAGATIATRKYWAIYRPDFKFAMNNSGPETIYLLDKANNIVSSVSYNDAKENVSYDFDGADWRWNNFLTPSEKNEFEKKLKVAIVKIKANPEGKDTIGEEIYLKNNSKKKINLKTWSIATGSKTLYNHPITKDFIIQPGKTKKITRKYSLFTLNNKKGAIELRYPNGEVASRVKYDKKKESVKDDEVYELAGKNWQWTAPAEEITTSENNLSEDSSVSAENSEDVNQNIELDISDEEITLNLGKYSAENKLALAEIGFIPTSKNLLQSRENSGIVLGAFSARDKIHQPVEIRPINSWQKTLQKSNQLFNLLINQVVSLI